MSEPEPVDGPPHILLSPPHVTDDDRAAVLAALDSGWLAPAGPALAEFEAAAAQRTGRAAAAALSSGTAALHLALQLAGVGPGDRVLVSDLTFAASANAVAYLGGSPVFVDAEARSWNLDPELVCAELHASAKRGDLPRAVVAVDLYGQVADLEPIAEVCAEYDVTLVEDAAEALGATYRGRPAGSFGRVAVLSFNGNKVITTSGGGMLVADDPELVERARYLAAQARQPVLHYEHTEVGYNYRLSNLLAALGTSQLRQLDTRVARRRAINAAYREALADVPGVDLMPDAGTGEPIWWLSALTVDPAVAGTDRDAVIAHLAANRVEARPVWKPMHLQPLYADAPHLGGAVAARLFDQGLCLPSGSQLTDDDVERVVTLVRDAVLPHVRHAAATSR
jgi:dTDP-4-amino-4,6-dideoxygalactose transaminase